MEATTTFGFTGTSDLEEIRRSDIVAFDVETDGKHVATAELVGFSMATSFENRFFFMADDPYAPWEVFTNPDVQKVAHNASFDRAVMKRHGIVVNNIIDTMVAAQLCGRTELSLKALVMHYYVLSIMAYSDLKRKMSSMTLEELLEYSGPHSAFCLRLWQEKFQPELKKFREDKLFFDTEMPLLEMLSDMELTGAAVSRDTLNELGGYFEGKLKGLEYQMGELTGKAKLNWRSADQVAEYLFKELKLPHGRMTSSGKRPTVDAETLEKIKDRHKVVPPLLEHRRFSKLKGTYVDGLIKRMVNGRVHTTFKITGTGTGRLSSTDPNLQNIPMRTEEGKKIRSAFIAHIEESVIEHMLRSMDNTLSPDIMEFLLSNGNSVVLFKVDYEQLELVYMAHKSQEPKMLEAFRNGEDIHLRTALEIFGDPAKRFFGKTINFTVIYGGGAGVVAEKTGMSRKEAEQWLKAYFTKYNVLAEWIGTARKQSRENGFAMTDGGRIRIIPEFNSDSPMIVEHGYKAAISTIIQGSSSELVKRGMLRCYNVIGDSVIRPVLQVHDEVVFECPVSLVPYMSDVVMRTMPSNELSVPVRVSLAVGKNWRDMKEFKWQV